MPARFYFVRPAAATSRRGSGGPFFTPRRKAADEDHMVSLENIAPGALLGCAGLGLLTFGWRRHEIAPVLIYAGLGAVGGAWLFDAMGLLAAAGAATGAVLGGLAGAYLHSILSAMAVGTAAAVLLAATYWALAMRQPLAMEQLATEGGWRSVQAVLVAHPSHGILCCVLPAVGMLAGLLVAIRRQRETGAVLCSLLGAFAVTFAGLLLAGQPANLATLSRVARPGWLWGAALSLAAAGSFLQILLLRLDARRGAARALPAATPAVRRRTRTAARAAS
jgi:hypothetical protein